MAQQSEKPSPKPPWPRPSLSTMLWPYSWAITVLKAELAQVSPPPEPERKKLMELPSKKALHTWLRLTLIWIGWSIRSQVPDRARNQSWILWVWMNAFICAVVASVGVLLYVWWSCGELEALVVRLIT